MTVVLTKEELYELIKKFCPVKKEQNKEKIKRRKLEKQHEAI